MYTKVLIKLLNQTKVDDLCFDSRDTTNCAGVECDDCPFKNRTTVNALITELKENRATCECSQCGTKFEAVITDCPVCNTLESVRLL